MIFPIAIPVHDLVRNKRLEESEVTHPKFILQTHKKVIPPAKAIDCGKERRWGNKKPRFKPVAANKVPAYCSILFTVTAEFRTGRNKPKQTFVYKHLNLCNLKVMFCHSIDCLRKSTPPAAFPQVILLPSYLLPANKTIAAIQLQKHRSFFWLQKMERRFKGIFVLAWLYPWFAPMAQW